MIDSIPHRSFVILSDVHEVIIDGKPMFLSVVGVQPNFGGAPIRIPGALPSPTRKEALTCGQDAGKRWINRWLGPEA